MNQGLALGLLIAWPPVVAALFRAIGPRRAVLVGVLGGFLFLPPAQVGPETLGFAFPLNKQAATGLGLILGALAFGRRTLLTARPGWLDLPVAASYLAPLAGLVSGLPDAPVDVVDFMISRGLGLVVPYAMARAYLGGEDGPGSVAVALVISGLSYIPICLYEEVAGPSRYLGVLIYGIPYKEGMVDRLGGWRPEGFLTNGLALAAWMALTAVTATWLWLGGQRIGRWPAWPAAMALVLTSISCRGIYGALVLAAGLASAGSARWLRTRAVLVGVVALAVAYAILRLTGTWDGETLVRVASLAGRPGTVDWRLRAEDQVIGRVLATAPLLGFGDYIWHAEGLTLWPDGAWLHALWMGGLVGLVLWAAAWHIVPASVALARPPGRPEAWQAAGPSWALACWCSLHLLDSLHNTSYLTPTALVAGTLIGRATARKDAEGPRPEPPTAAGRGDARSPGPFALIATVVVLVALEAVGRLGFAGRFQAPPLQPRPESTGAHQ